jgi:hypothetical protein
MPSTEVRTFQVTIPAGTAIAAPAVTALTMPSRIVRRILVRFPPGPQGQVGVQLRSGDVQVIPWTTGTWLVGDGEAIPWEPTGTIESGAWQLAGYNTGAFDHTIYLTYELDPVGSRVSSGGPPLVIAP